MLLSRKCALTCSRTSLSFQQKLLCHSSKHPQNRFKLDYLKRRHLSTTIPAIDARIVNEFANQNADLARRALQVPPVPASDEYPYRYQPLQKSRDNKHNIISKPPNLLTLTDYLRFRNWGAEFIEHNVLHALISHAMTFPLTLAHHVDHFLPPIGIGSLSMSDHPMDCTSQNSKLTSRKETIRICCVGSRAEANLPDEYWREFLIASNLFHSHDDAHIHTHDLHNASGQSMNTCTNIHWILDFVGPEISANMKSRHIALPQPPITEHEDDHVGNCFHESLTMNFNSNYLHDYVFHLYKSKEYSTDDILNMYSGFLLFNPGCGHPHLEKSWKPSMEYILKTKKKVLMTAHSMLDHTRDAVMLSKLMRRNDHDALPLQYEDNPFASRMAFEDPFPTTSQSAHGADGTYVRPNYAVLRYTSDDGSTYRK